VGPGASRGERLANQAAFLWAMRPGGGDCWPRFRVPRVLKKLQHLALATVALVAARMPRDEIAHPLR
ncbi:MAG TPA: hypothetical protein PK594_09115, partial [Mycobacterium sp.]|nr:hypothetical protein [Mycobacterium sp.]